MKMNRTKQLILFGLLGVFIPLVFVTAHQPRLVEDAELIEVENPEISQAFYGNLSGEPAVYSVNSDEPFLLYLSLLVPDLKRQDTDFAVEVIVDDEVVGKLDGNDHNWEFYHEEFANDDYLKGPEFEMGVMPGDYRVRVSSPDNWGKYVLVIGWEESFPFNEIVNTIKTLPKLKKDFFNKSVWSAYWNLVGLFMLLITMAFLILLFVVIKIIKKKHGKPHKE